MLEILEKIEFEIEKRGISEEQIAEILKQNRDTINRRIIGGLSSVSVVDRENQKIPVFALKKAVDRFMKNIFARPVSVFHSDIQCGRVLPFWTNPDTGETLKSEVTDIGWYSLVEIRDDIEIANKVWGEILKGNIRSFSIAGSSKDKLQKQENGISYEQINELDLYEIALCFSDSVKVWTKRGLISIKDVIVCDYVYTHKNRWRKVSKVFSRSINEDLIKITTDFGEFTGTVEHPIRILQGNSEKASSLNYRWISMNKIKIKDLISCHKVTGYCDYCGAPIFSKLNVLPCRNFCSMECRRKVPGNREGKTLISGDIGAIKFSLKMRGRPGKYQGNPESTKKAGITLSNNQEFKQKRKEIQTELWKDLEYNKKQGKAIHSRRKELGTYERFGKTMRELWSTPEFVKKMLKIWKRKPNKLEQLLDECLQENCPEEWKYVGCGDFLIESKNPDFVNINSKKKIIELDGVYWHKDPEERKKRIALFESYGYDTLIVTDKELKKDPISCLDRIKEFTYNNLSNVINIELIKHNEVVYNLEVEEDNSYTTEFMIAHNCETPVNPMSKFDILWNPKKIEI